MSYLYGVELRSKSSRFKAKVFCSFFYLLTINTLVKINTNPWGPLLSVPCTLCTQLPVMKIFMYKKCNVVRIPEEPPLFQTRVARAWPYITIIEVPWVSSPRLAPDCLQPEHQRRDNTRIRIYRGDLDQVCTIPTYVVAAVFFIILCLQPEPITTARKHDFKSPYRSSKPAPILGNHSHQV